MPDPRTRVLSVAAPAELSPVQEAAQLTVSPGARVLGQRLVPAEHAVALTYNGSTFAVMMASPCDLVDFGIGFSLTEGVVGSADEIESIDVVPLGPAECEVRMWTTPANAQALAARRRRSAGPVGCGLCGVESLREALREPEPVPDTGFRTSVGDILAAVASLSEGQHLHARVGASHAAALWNRTRGLVALREDVGRHNALDKLVGALARRAVAPERSILVLTSRISVDLVGKAARLGAPVLVGLSAPTAAAIGMAGRAGLTLVAGVRERSFDVFTHPERIEAGAPSTAADGPAEHPGRSSHVG